MKRLIKRDLQKRGEGEQRVYPKTFFFAFLNFLNFQTSFFCTQLLPSKNPAFLINCYFSKLICGFSQQCRPVWHRWLSISLKFVSYEHVAALDKGRSSLFASPKRIPQISFGKIDNKTHLFALFFFFTLCPLDGSLNFSVSVWWHQKKIFFFFFPSRHALFIECKCQRLHYHSGAFFWNPCRDRDLALFVRRRHCFVCSKAVHINNTRFHHFVDHSGFE